MTHPSLAKSIVTGVTAVGICLVSACSSADKTDSSSSAVTACGIPVTLPTSVQPTCDLPSAIYSAGMAQAGTSGALAFEIVSVNGDAVAQGIDAWTIKITDANCAPVDGATVTVKAWMPEHNHGWTAATSTGEGGGAYDIGNLDLFMDGFWQITITATASVTSEAGALVPVTDSTVFSFCLSN
jgi:YtkA-like protein